MSVGERYAEARYKIMFLAEICVVYILLSFHIKASVT